MSCPTYFTDKIIEIPTNSNETELKCMGVNLSLTDWKLLWNGGTCQQYYSNLISSGQNLSFSQTGFDKTVKNFNYIFGTYFGPQQDINDKGGHIITQPGKPNYDPFQDTLINACSSVQYGLAGACQEASQNMCKSCSVNSVLANESLLKLCGCQVSSLTDIQLSSGVDPSCDPLCAREQVAKKRDPITGQIESCKQTVCVINDVAIRSSESFVSGISFTQVCPQCSVSTGTTCRCIVDASIPGQYQDLDITTNFNQYCGENSICMSVDPTTGVSTPVDCNTSLIEVETYKIVIPLWVWVISAIILVLAIVLLLVCLNLKDTKKQSVAKIQFNQKNPYVTGKKIKK